MPVATPDDPQYVPRKTVNASYRPKNYLMSPGLKRAREPYLVRNAVTGLALAAFGVGVWAYSISAVKQDVFDDVDEEARVLARSGAAASMKSIEDEQKQAKAQTLALAQPFVFPPAPTIPEAADARPASGDTGGRGLLVELLDSKYPGLLDPSRKTLVWGAPPVDRVGKTSDKI